MCLLLEQREREEHEEGSEELEEGQDSPIPSGDDIHFYGNQTLQGGTGQWTCVFAREFRVGWQLDPELLISSGDAQVSRSVVATATVSGVLWLCRGTPTKPTHGDRSPVVHSKPHKGVFSSLCPQSLQENVIKDDYWKINTNRWHLNCHLLLRILCMQKAKYLLLNRW